MSATTDQPRRRLSKEARRASLIAAAETVFGEVGYSGATMELVAAESGVTRSLLYEHFASVDELYLECHRVARAEMQERVFAGVLAAGPEVERQLRAGLLAYFQFVDERPERFQVLYGPGAAGGPVAEQTAALRFDSAQQIAALVTAAAPRIPEVEAVAAAHMISGAAQQLARWWYPDRRMSLDELADGVMRVVWPGLRGEIDAANA
jgi:AcrR family transcriptional regulator